jgi:hypothetical protein
MSYDYYYDDFNDADQNVIDYKEVTDLEDTITDLKEQVQGLRDDELFILYHLMDFRDKIKNVVQIPILAELEGIIRCHSKEVIEQAKLYTKRGQAWDYD